jgi:hypothetical protein
MYSSGHIDTTRFVAPAASEIFGLISIGLIYRYSGIPDCLALSSAKNISVWADWLRQSGRAPSEPSETPRWRITPRPASIPRVELHIALRSLFRRFFSLCWPPTLNKHPGVLANCDHTSDWVHCVHACIGIAMHKDPRNCADPLNLAKSE